MRAADLGGMAFANLWRRKLRTALTVLAVVIGAALVALMVSIASGLHGFIVEQFGMAMSPTAIRVSAQPGAFMGQTLGPHEIDSTQDVATQPFTAGNLAQIAALPGVEAIGYNINVSALYIQPQGSAKMYSVTLSVAPEYEARLRPLVVGSYFADSAAGQCLIAYDYVQSFGWTGAQDALGKQVSVTLQRQVAGKLETRSYSFTVAGVLAKTMTSSDVLVSTTDGAEMGRWQRNNAKLYTEAAPGGTIFVKVASEAEVDAVAAEIKKLGFGVLTPREILAQINNVFRVIQVGLGAFGGIALVVAAIGIINTLLMAIYERTREIGVMKAVGATRANIRLLFTAEGGALGLLGGVSGCLLAFVLGQGLNYVGARTFLSNYPGFTMSVFSPALVLGVIALTTAISLLAALYPAARAARLDAVEALRYE